MSFCYSFKDYRTLVLIVVVYLFLHLTNQVIVPATIVYIGQYNNDDIIAWEYEWHGNIIQSSHSGSVPHFVQVDDVGYVIINPRDPTVLQGYLICRYR